MKRLQIMIEEELDAALDRQAAKEGVSKAALVRRYVGDKLKPLPPLEQDPLWEMVAVDADTEPIDDVDEYLYGPVDGS